MSVNEQVQVEIQIFLHALDSYAARFAADPNISFEEYRASLMERFRRTPLRSRRHTPNN